MPLFTQPLFERIHRRCPQHRTIEKRCGQLRPKMPLFGIKNRKYRATFEKRAEQNVCCDR